MDLKIIETIKKINSIKGQIESVESDIERLRVLKDEKFERIEFEGRDFKNGHRRFITTNEKYIRILTALALPEFIKEKEKDLHKLNCELESLLR